METPVQLLRAQAKCVGAYLKLMGAKSNLLSTPVKPLVANDKCAGAAFPCAGLSGKPMEAKSKLLGTPVQLLGKAKCAAAYV